MTAHLLGGALCRGHCTVSPAFAPSPSEVAVGLCFYILLFINALTVPECSYFQPCIVSLLEEMSVQLQALQ